jgi:hypothetical protein
VAAIAIRGKGGASCHTGGETRNRNGVERELSGTGKRRQWYRRFILGMHMAPGRGGTQARDAGRGVPDWN